MCEHSRDMFIYILPVGIILHLHRCNLVQVQNRCCRLAVLIAEEP